ncbi:MAG: hypothetical protein LBI58_01355 [Tannerellaceae bacterium]|nr:hypothetical protein [Tannerellaceae bacterium]
MSCFIRQNRIVVWLLVSILAFPLAVRSAHVHHYEDLTETSHHHSCDDCLICHFELYSYVETDIPGITPQLTFESITPPTVREKACTSFPLSHSPRAPPAHTA